VDFHLRHLSGGTSDATLALARTQFINKYARALRSRWVATPSVVMFISGVNSLSAFMSSRFLTRVAFRLGRAGRKPT